MAQSLEAYLKKLDRRLNRLARIKNPTIQAADNIISAEIPVYTGAYQQAVKKKSTKDYAGIWVDRKGLIAAQPKSITYDVGGEQVTVQAGVDRAFDNIHGEPPEGPYPLRIEAHGGPGSGNGAGMWELAADTARQVIAEELARVARSN